MGADHALLGLAAMAGVCCGLSAGPAASHAQVETRHDACPGSPTVYDLQAKMDAGRTSARALVTRALERIAAHDRKGEALRAVLMLNPEALRQAKALDRERAKVGPRSALHGVPVLIKDNIDMAGFATTAGSVLMRGTVARHDAPVVARLKAAGAIILARTNMAELAFGDSFSSLGGQTRNPHDPTRSVSGSSSGSAAGVAAGYAPMALGTDTLGSIREPAAFAGLVGFRPSSGLLAMDGIVPLVPSLDTVGPITRNVCDAAAMMDALDPRGGFGASLESVSLSGLRVGILRGFMGADEEVDGLTDMALAALVREGAIVEEVALPAWMAREARGFENVLHTFEFGPALNAYLEAHQPGAPPSIAAMSARAHRYVIAPPEGTWPNVWRWGVLDDEATRSGRDTARYEAVRDHAIPLYRASLEAVFTDQGLDVLVFPTSPTRPWPIASNPGVPSASTPRAFLIPALAGNPEITIPMGFTSDHLPVGLSFLGQRFRDHQVMAIGHAFEQAYPAYRPPRLFE